MADERRVYRVAEKLLEATIAGIEANGYVAPSLRFISPGIPAWEDEQVCVSCPRIVPIVGAVEASRPTRPTRLAQRAGEYLVWLIIDAPAFYTTIGEFLAPHADDLSASADRLYGSTLSAINGVFDATKGSSPSFGTNTVRFVDTTTVGPEGGLVGQIFRWNVDLAADVT